MRLQTKKLTKLEQNLKSLSSSSEKREFLKKHFSELKGRNLCNSRDASFEQYILNATNGEGVDVILNSLAEEKLKATLRCLAQHGRFLEIGKLDLSKNTPLGMAIFLKNISFHGILLDALFDNNSDSSRCKIEVVQLVKNGIANGTVKPLNSILFDSDQAEQAFRFIASGKHIGKVVLKFKKELKSLPSLADRIKTSVEKISSIYKNLQPEDLTLAFDLYYKKILMSLKYMPRHKLKKEITLIKASDSLTMTKNISETYDLEKVCDRKITVHTVKGTHKYFILEKGAKEVSNLLNEIFSH